MGRVGKRNLLIRKSLDKYKLPKKVDVKQKELPKEDENVTEIINEIQNFPNCDYSVNKNNFYYNYIYNYPNVTNSDIKIINEKLDKEIGKYNVVLNFMDLFALKSFIKDKNIALIANSTDLLKNKLGEMIDSHDIVIRFNSYKIIEEFTGKKTTIHASVYLQNENLNEYAPIRIIISSNIKNWVNKLLTINKYKQGVILKYNHQQVIQNKFKEPAPTTSGTTVLLLLLKLGGYSKINLFGYNFYKTGEDSIFRNQNGMSFPISKVHNYDLEKEFLTISSHNYDEKYNIYTFHGNSPL